MPRVTKHKQQKRKNRQRENRAARMTAKAQPKPFTLPNEPYSPHAMSAAQQSEAKKAFWKVFSGLPSELQKEALQSFEKQDRKVTHLDIEGLMDLLGETLNHFMRPHALCAVLSQLSDEGVLALPTDIEEHMDALDEAVYKYISKAMFIIGRFNLMEGMTPEEKDEAILKDTDLSEALIPTLMMFQETNDEIITPIVKYTEEYTKIVDDRVVQFGHEHNFADLNQATRALHEARLTQYIEKKKAEA